MNLRAHSLWICLSASSVIVFGCADASSPVATSVGSDAASTGGASTTEVGGDTGADGGLDDDPREWPDGALGRYYLDLGFPLPPARYIGALVNIDLRRDRLVVTHVECTGEEHTEMFELHFEGEEAFVRPEPGQTWLIWNGEPVAKGLVIRPGLTCAKLVSEFIDPASPSSAFAKTWSWRRGAVFVTDFCVDDVEWGADVSPDVSGECPDPPAADDDDDRGS